MIHLGSPDNQLKRRIFISGIGGFVHLSLTLGGSAISPDKKSKSKLYMYMYLLNCKHFKFFFGKQLIV